MSARLTRRQSEVGVADAEPASSSGGGSGSKRKPAASPVRKQSSSAKKSAAGHSPVVASPPPPATASSAAAVASPSRVSGSGRGRKAANSPARPAPILSPSNSSGRPVLPLCPKENKQLQAARDADYEDEAASGDDSDNESIGSRVSRSARRSRSRSKPASARSSPRLASHAHPSPELIPASPLASSDSDGDSVAPRSNNKRHVGFNAESPVGTEGWGQESAASWGQDLPPVGGPPRKGSDHRRAMTAAKLREDGARREVQWKNLHPDLKAAASPPKRGCCASLLRAIGLTTLATVLVVMLGFISSLNAAEHSSPAHSGDAIASLTRTLSAQHPRLQGPIVDVLEPALRHHAESFAELLPGSDEDGGAGAASAEWLSAGLATLQARKPLVLVLAVDDTQSGGDSPTGRRFFQDLVEQLQPPEGSLSEQLRVLDLRKQLGQSVRQQGRAESRARTILHDWFESTQPPALSAAFDSALSFGRSVAPFLFPAPPAPSSLAHVSSCVNRGAVLVTDAATLPRAAAEAFHLYADDVAAPVTRALIVFEVDIAAVRRTAKAQGEGRLEAGEAVRRTLEESWSRGAPPAGALVDEVLRPLISRIARNIVDLTAE